jgi:hypothetical protein
VSKSVEANARNLIASHGDAALRFAVQSMRKVRALAMEDEVEEWERVIAAIRALQKTAEPY